MGIMSLNKLKNKKSKKNIRKTFRGKKKIGGNSLCMYSNDMDNSAKGVYGFHPLWNKNYCSNSNFYESGNDNKAKLMKLLGGNKKKTVKRKKIRSKSIKKLQKGGDPSKTLTEAYQQLAGAIEEGEKARAMIQKLEESESNLQYEGDEEADAGTEKTPEEVNEVEYDAFADDGATYEDSRETERTSADSDKNQDD